MNLKIQSAVKLLEQHGFTVTPPNEPEEAEYQKALRTGIKPAIWPPIVMTMDDLYHFRKTHGLPAPI